MNILLADDHSIVRRGLKEILLEEFPDANFQEAADGQELIRKMRAEKFDVIISDVSMPGKNGLEALKVIKSESPTIPVLVLSIHPEELYAIRVLKAGASGYLTKESAPEELVKAVRMVMAGRKYITPSLAEKMASNLDNDLSKMPHELLSDRELDVLKLIAGGKTVSEIANDLSLSVNTISTYRARLLEKMNLKSNSELTFYAISNNLI
ncbi:MAG TPA: response regulator transcription factor [Bacteroidia bacterium]|jgi:DNA-binding NarL/FixJ family response regulator|nr:response regulator transcription factor [Bacteroidota bacterium]MBK7570449.1 response regulator transcription factor [Bacteroidota bacterium]MBK8584609.1 response regulator transcription factor [Bacteroidota bacterium]MBP9922217.1 response regulator transcription factor [Bacteroidia bacterium]HQW23216.1 response regulator transcription factor [Bacteroidia bacterium]